MAVKGLQQDELLVDRQLSEAIDHSDLWYGQGKLRTLAPGMVRAVSHLALQGLSTTDELRSVPVHRKRFPGHLPKRLRQDAGIGKLPIDQMYHRFTTVSRRR